MFTAERGDGHFVGIPRVLSRLAAEASIEDLTAHRLRHSFASVAAELGYSELNIASLLGHASRGVTQRYVHIDKAVLQAAEHVSAKMAEWLELVRPSEVKPTVVKSRGK